MDVLSHMTQTNIVLHPHVLEILFAYQAKVIQVFKDVLGLYGISHMSISRVSERQELLTFSSTPSLEFNLFKSNLWRFDQTYQTRWYTRCTGSPWQSLYNPAQYNALHYLKQVKPQYPLGLSFAAKRSNHHVIYSIASQKDNQHMREFFKNPHDDFYKIGLYCSNLLLPIIDGCDKYTTDISIL